jgi:hypothetical protein
VPELVQMTAGDPPELWSELGFALQGDVCRIGLVDIVLDPSVGKGIRRWAFSGGTDAPALVEGLPTEWLDGPGEATSIPHPNGVTTIDHVVLLSPDVDRTIESLARLGFDPRRERLTDTYGAPMRQVFFRAGEVILELIGGQEATGEGGIRVFGLAFTSDLDASAAFLAERLHPAKDAVQPGRRIATLDKRAGSTVAIALMSASPTTVGADDE